MCEADSEKSHLKKHTIENMKELMDNASKWKWISLVFVISTSAFIGTTVSVWIIKDQQIQAAKIPQCQPEVDDDIVQKHKRPTIQHNVISALTPKEIDLVLEFLYRQENLNLKSPSTASISESFIHTIELQPPKKTDVIRYLDSNEMPPKRVAKVFIFRGDRRPPLVEEYLVGTLPNITYMRLMNTTARNTQIPYDFRPFSSFEFMAIYKYVIRRIHNLAGHVLRESYNATPFECGDQCLRFSMTPISSAFLEKGKRKAWFWFAYDVEFFTLHPLDFQFLVDTTSSDPKLWVIENIWYAKQLFPSLTDFLDQYRCKAINKTRISFPSNEDKMFSSLKFRTPLIPEENLRPPVTYQPDGPRISIFGNEMKYLAWDMKYRMSPTAGLQLFDVKFDSQRILYEISMQEVIVLYSGYNPTARMLNYADSAGLFGTRCRGLLPGVDCPAHAQFIDTHMYSANEGGHRTYENAMCVFEHTTDTPLRRHRAYGRTGAFYAGLVNTAMVVRTIISVINYDYIYDFYFYQHGGVEIRVSLAGYLGTTYNFPEELPYGVHLNGHTNAGIHNHLFHFKVDLDVKGTYNRFETLDIHVENETDPWFGGHHVQRIFTRNTRKTEMDSLYKYNFGTPKYLLVSSYNETTEHGIPKSYRILPSGMSKLLVPADFGFAKSIPWAQYQLVVTKQKDDEETSSSIFSMWDARDPVVNFQDYFKDDENIVDEDLVAWVTLGTQHIPQTENIPNTLTLGTQLSLYILPYNYFDEDPSMRSRDAVRITPKDSKRPLDGANIERYNLKSESKCIARVVLPDNNLKRSSRFLFT